MNELSDLVLRYLIAAGAEDAAEVAKQVIARIDPRDPTPVTTALRIARESIKGAEDSLPSQTPSRMGPAMVVVPFWKSPARLPLRVRAEVKEPQSA